MNREETANLLTAMAAYDRRTLGTADVIAWHELMADLTFADALEAVKRYYAEHTEWMMPAHVRRLVRDIVRERSISPWAPGQHGVPRDQQQPEVTGRISEGDVSAPVLALVTGVRAYLPTGSREALFPRRVAWEQEQAAFRRQQEAAPNPHYRPDAAAPRPVEVCPFCTTGLEEQCPWHQG